MDQFNTQLEPRPAHFLDGTTSCYGYIAPYSDAGIPGDADDPYAIFFPALPEELTLCRQATYSVVSAMPIPDGIHVYQYTSPLEIPLSFSLHWNDTDYCKDGPVTLLKIGAILHALTLPIIHNEGETASPVTLKVPTETPADGTTTTAGGSDAATPLNANDARYYDNTVVNSAKNIDFPPVCKLELVLAGSFKIACSGYVKDVKVSFRGPWMASNNADYKNLPTSADYSLTFVNVPCYTNKLGTYATNSGDGARAFTSAGAHIVASRLYDSNRIRSNAHGDGQGVITAGIPRSKLL